MAEHATKLNHLVIVCCHAIYLGHLNDERPEDNWLIESFQKGETPTFIQHIKAGLDVLAGDPQALLIFSGSAKVNYDFSYTTNAFTRGPTKKPRTNLSEGDSYLNFAKDHYFQDGIDPSRIISETHATDSYQNVLFCLLKFRLHTGLYPQRVTVVTHEFKRARFMDCHFPAVGLLPLPGSSRQVIGKVSVVGINPPEEVTPLQSLVSGEASKGIGLWKRDLYGVGEDLAGKRAKRGWRTGMEEIFLSNANLETVVGDLLRWNGGTGNEWFPRLKELPWAY